jgi:hypothetical protein
MALFCQAREGNVLDVHEVRFSFAADVPTSKFACSYDDPFYHPVSYSPTDKEEINRGMVNARRLLSPHILVLQMLLSRLQAARYRRPGLMLLIQRLVLTSARAYRYIRSVLPSLHFKQFLSKILAHTHWLARRGSPSCFSALRL